MVCNGPMPSIFDIAVAHSFRFKRLAGFNGSTCLWDCVGMVIIAHCQRTDRHECASNTKPQHFFLYFLAIQRKCVVEKRNFNKQLCNFFELKSTFTGRNGMAHLADGCVLVAIAGGNGTPLSTWLSSHVALTLFACNFMKLRCETNGDLTLDTYLHTE